jgi:hypothetical protein
VVVAGAGLLVTVVELLVVELEAVGEVLVEVGEPIVVVEVIGGCVVVVDLTVEDVVLDVVVRDVLVVVVVRLVDVVVVDRIVLDVVVLDVVVRDVLVVVVVRLVDVVDGLLVVVRSDVDVVVVVINLVVVVRRGSTVVVVLVDVVVVGMGNVAAKPPIWMIVLLALFVKSDVLTKRSSPLTSSNTTPSGGATKSEANSASTGRVVPLVGSCVTRSNGSPVAGSMVRRRSSPKL